jgi:hypothetical protein
MDVPPVIVSPFDDARPAVLTPPAKVLVAEDEVTFRRFASTPPANVDVAVVEVALKYGAPMSFHDSMPPTKVDDAVEVEVM